LVPNKRRISTGQFGDVRHNRISGGKGNDVLEGEEGGDTHFGEEGDDCPMR
jgi:Ca2+-binding RTX toxin-like protein